MIDENFLNRTSREIGIVGGGITLQIEKKAEMAVALKAYIYLIMDAQCSSLLCTRKMLHMLEPYTALSVVPTGVEKPHLALNLLEREYLGHFNFIIILCSILWTQQDVLPMEVVLASS